MRKECYGLIVPTDGEIKYLYEDPYNYIESIGCKPIDDYLGTLEDIDEENGPIRNPSYILGNNNNNFNILFYSKDGLKSKDKINNIINAFCNAFMYGTKFDNLILDIYDSAIILPGNSKLMTDKDKKELKDILKDLKWFYI